MINWYMIYDHDDQLLFDLWSWWSIVLWSIIMLINSYMIYDHNDQLLNDLWSWWSIVIWSTIMMINWYMNYGHDNILLYDLRKTSGPSLTPFISVSSPRPPSVLGTWRPVYLVGLKVSSLFLLIPNIITHRKLYRKRKLRKVYSDPKISVSR